MPTMLVAARGPAAPVGCYVRSRPRSRPRATASLRQEVIRTPPQAPRANAFAERWECTDRMVIAGERHLAAVLGGYTAHDNAHRPHRSLGQRPPEPRSEVAHVAGAKVRRRPVLDGLINEYEQAA